ncbi:MAG: DUF4143 domain-containing protein [Chitinivibrionales bacterium]|nr:DUF4143 domain-containing protein [Chitinivibrionales bacterium]
MVYESMELLCMAGLVTKVHHTAAQGIPLGAQINPKRFKAVPMDLGLHQRMLGLNLSELVTASPADLINKGCIAEVFAGLEILSNQSPHTKARLFYWHREAGSSNAEVDYVIQKGSKIIPVEVKSGKRGAMQSLNLFMNSHACETAVRLSLENVNHYKSVTILPVYLVGRLVQEYFSL